MGSLVASRQKVRLRMPLIVEVPEVAVGLIRDRGAGSRHSEVEVERPTRAVDRCRRSS